MGQFAHTEIIDMLSSTFIDLCEVAGNMQLNAGNPRQLSTPAGFSSTFKLSYRDSSQSRIVLSLLHGKREPRATGLTRAMAFRFISRSTLA